MFRRLLLLNGIAILSVLIFHSAGWGFVAMFSWSHRYLPPGTAPFSQQGSLQYFMLRLLEQAAVFALPAFLFVSGIFIAVAAGRAATLGWKVIWSRVRGLLIPYLFWTLALWILYYAEGIRQGPAQYLANLLTGSTNPAYYYVPLLCQYYLLSPFIVRLARTHWRGLLIGAGVVQLAVQLSYYPLLLGAEAPWAASVVDLMPKWFFPAKVFWFVAGVVAGFHLKALEQSLPRFRWPLLAATVLLLPLSMVEWELMLRLSGLPWLDHRETLLDTIYSGTAILAFLGFYRTKLPQAAHLDTLGSQSFGIYIVHSPVMELAARAIYHIAPWMLAYQALFLPLIFGAGLAVPLLLMALMRRSPFVTYYRYSFG